VNITAFFGLLGGLLVLAFTANRLFSWTRVPDVVVLMAAGVVLGPVLHLAKPAQFVEITHAFGTLALLLILFEGGLELNIRETIRHFPGGLVFGVVSYAFAFVLIGFVAHFGLKISIANAALVGAVLGCTSSTVILPVLQQLGAREPVKVVLLIESTLGDVLGVLTVGLLLDLRSGATTGGGDAMRGLAIQILIPLGAAFVVGFAWSRLLPYLTEQRFWQVLTFAVVLLIYSVTESLHGNGLLAVLGFGLTLSNLPARDKRVTESGFWFTPKIAPHEKILSFHAELSFLVRTFFFVLIGVVVDLSGLGLLLWIVVPGILGAIFLSRWLAVQASRWSWNDVKPGERELMVWIFPRGLITIVLALQVLEAVTTGLSFLSGIAFVAILFTNFLVIVGGIRMRKIGASQTASETPLDVAPESAPIS
jgi:cell volume regulation protein A